RQAPAVPPPLGRSAAMPAAQPGSALWGDDLMEQMPPPAPTGPMPAPVPTQQRSTQMPSMPSGEMVRPRVVSASKEKNAAAASLRQSAAVGENYLNELLTGGMLDVAGVRVPDADFDLRPDRRWGRSTRRAFIFLFVVLVLGIGGGGTWYWWSEKQKAEVALAAASVADVEGDVKELRDALEKDPTSLLTYAYVAGCSGLETLLYG